MKNRFTKTSFWMLKAVGLLLLIAVSSFAQKKSSLLEGPKGLENVITIKENTLSADAFTYNLNTATLLFLPFGFGGKVA
jgi:hypothetical protein